MLSVTSLWNLVTRVGSVVESTINDQTIRIAVTGLSRAGKTVFLTSLLVNLLAMRAGRQTLPAFQSLLDQHGPGRLRNIRLLPAGASTTPRFDVLAKLAELAADRPHWPARTEDLATVELELEVRPAPGVLNGLRAAAGTPRLRLEFLDYPGEWLLDLPLLRKSFATWSTETLALLRQPPRAAIAAPFLDFLGVINPTAPAEDSLLLRGHRLYQQVLLRCRDELGLRYLQPGRFLNLGPRSEAPFLWFFPLPQASDHPADGTVGALLRDRYDAYRADMRASFFDTAFRAFDRQIVLVDVLGALHAGKAAYEDTEHAIADIAASLSDRGGLLGWLLGTGTGIARVAFVATKADHVPELQRDNLRALLQDMSHLARRGMPEAEGVSFHAAASVVSTTDGWAEREGGMREPVVWGRELGSETRRAYHVGAVPISRPPDGFWSGRYFDLPVFTPPPIDPSGALGIRQSGLDDILVDLIGDLL